MDYELVRYTPALLPEIAALRAQEWREAAAQSAAYLAWKYEQDPYSDSMRFYVALAGGNVVGMRGMYGGLLAGPDGTVCPIAAGSDTLVAPAHRGQRLFNKLTRYALDDLAEQGCDYALSLSANRTSELLQLRSGWARVCAFQPLFWGDAREPASTGSRRRSPAVGETRRKGGPYQGARAALGYLKRVKRAIEGSNQAPFQGLEDRLERTGTGRRVVVESAPRPPQMAELVRRQEQDEPRIRMVRDERYYAWRFNNPRSTYRFLFAEAGDGELDCFIVLQQPRRGGQVAVVDWQFSDQRSWLDMLGAVLESGGVSGLSIWSATLPPSLRQSLDELGFRAGPEIDTRAHPARGLLVTATRPGVSPAEWLLDGRPLVQPEHWDLRMIFSDYY